MIDKDADPSQQSIDFGTGEPATGRVDGDESGQEVPRADTDDVPRDTDGIAILEESVDPAGAASSENGRAGTDLESALDDLEQLTEDLRGQVLEEVRGLAVRALDEAVERLRDELRQSLESQLAREIPDAVERAFQDRRRNRGDRND